MKNGQLKIGNLGVMDASGSVLLEYAVLCCGIAVVLLKFMHAEFFNFGQGYVGLGSQWAEHVRILHRAMALPIP